MTQSGWRKPTPGLLQAERFAEVGEQLSIPKSQAIVASGTVYEEILRVAAETKCDVIVMASHRPGLQDYLIGPNASRVVRHAHCSVLVVRD